MNVFFEDIKQGLLSRPKALPSKYFYDAVGDGIFRRLMNSEEYYLSRCELEILRGQSDNIMASAPHLSQGFDLIELGAGDASKSIHLIDALLHAEKNFRYVPIDISENIIGLLNARLPETHPTLNLQPLRGEYLDMLEKHSKDNFQPKFIVFLGANIGNMSPADAETFCKDVGAFMNTGDQLLIGFDLKKNPHQILSAYNDREGLTRDFNLNMLSRINKELQCDFNLADFAHYATYDPLSGACRSFLICLKAQTIHFSDGTNSAEISLEENEPIFMEVSMKYSVQEVDNLALRSGFKTKNHFYDSKKWFLDSLWEKI